MLRLVLLRHGKADPRDSGGRLDHGRTLTPGGRRDVERMGAFLAREGILPDLALVSDAARTRETFEAAQAAFPGGIRAEFDPRLYLAHWRDVIAVVAERGKASATLVLVGHNPALAELAVRLAGSAGGESDAGFPTGAAAVLDFPMADWARLGETRGQLARLVTPAMLEGTAER